MSAETQKLVYNVGTWIFRGVIAILCWVAIQTFNGVKTSINNIEAKFEEVGKDVNSIKVDLGVLNTEVKNQSKDIDRIDRKTEPR